MFFKEKLVICGKTAHFYEYNKFFSKDEKKPRVSFGKKNKSNSEKLETHIYRIRRNVKYILQCNVDYEIFKPIFLTLTFKENVTSLTEANKIFTGFTKRLSYQIFKSKKNLLKYLVVPEFQKRGAVHYHIIYFNLPFVPDLFNRVSSIWGRGFVFVESIRNLEHLGNYIAKYFTKDSYDKRLLGQKAYFCSKGLKKPVVYYGSEAHKMVVDKLRLISFSSSYKVDELEVKYSQLSAWI